MTWTCQYGHVNEDPLYSAETYWCEFSPCTGYRADDDGPYSEDTDDLVCEPEQPPNEEPSEPCPGPHVGDDSEYPIDESRGTVRRTTSSGKIRTFPLPSANTNQTDRPTMPRFLISDRSQLVDYEGARGSGRVHQVIVEPLNNMIAAMRAEGERIDDKALREAYVHSPWRDPAGDGRTYLNVIKGVITAHHQCHQGSAGCVAFSQGHDGRYERANTHCPSGFQRVSFPSDLETEAQSVLGRRGSSAWNTFRDHLGQASGWTNALANYCLRQAGRFKAPAGGSPHHSGLVVDLNWPIWDGHRVRNHNISSRRNEWSRKSSVGVWLNQHAASFGFKSYNEADEIWHMEYVLWAGTAADPG